MYSIVFFERFEVTGKSMSEALIFASTNPQYDDRLFIELQVQCKRSKNDDEELCFLE